MIQQKDTAGIEHECAQAKFPGGADAWQRYLTRNLKVPDRFSTINPIGACIVVVGSLIDKVGKVNEAEILRSCQWSSDNKAIRVIKKEAETGYLLLLNSVKYVQAKAVSRLFGDQLMRAEK